MEIQHFYIEQGSGEPLILLHGNGEDSSYFKGQIGEFSKQYHVYALDTRGHGQTPRGDAPFTIRQFAEDLKGFMDEKGLKRAHILGFSDGGNIATVFAIKYPERVMNLILNGANLDASGVKRCYQIPIEIGYKIAKRSAGKSEKAARNAEMLGLMVNDPNVTVDELSGIKSPTLVLAGTRDMIKKKHTELIASGIPGAELRFIKGSHFIAAKKPEEFNRTVLEFLDRHSALKQ
ncbi:MAG: alpha/beta hydrolase [Lachnospiraceae bacterium]|nr:alpha/beta hydrolase [Lachnospiraceae bacterium]